MPQDYIEALIELRECVRRIKWIWKSGSSVRSDRPRPEFALTTAPREIGPLSAPKLNA
jgi:hypothetical protein